MTISISIWSDIACPWCFVGKQRLEQALKSFAQRDGAPAVSIRWRAFELDPRVREPTDTPYAVRIANKYGRTVADAQQMLDTMTQAIQAEGGVCDFDQVVVANTFNAHRLIQWAGATDSEGVTVGAQHVLTDALMRDYLGHGLNMASHEALLSVVQRLGLDVDGASQVLTSDAYAQVVRGDEQEAQQHGISGVPFFVIGQYGISGAQEAKTLLEVLERTQGEQRANATVTPEHGAGKTFCDDQGCDDQGCDDQGCDD